MPNYVKRLYTQFKPENYNLTLTVDDKNLKFNGTVIITGNKVDKPSKRFVFHQKDLKIISATVQKEDKKQLLNIPIVRINTQNSLNEVRLHTKDLIYSGHYIIKINFEGKINNNLDGIYPGYFKDKKIKKTIIATQFESHHARQAFPCIDEPEAKATFDLSLITNKAYTVLANTPILTSKNNKNLQTVRFETTPPMSTYLLAFVIGELEYLETITKNKITIRSYSTPDKVQLTKFSIKVAQQILDFFSDYFQIDYPLKKLDLVALPDFNFKK